MTTIRDVARTAGVSVATASRALNGHLNVTEGVRKRVTDAAAQLNYIPHSGARSLTRQRSDAIGVVLPDLFGEYFSELVRGIDSVAHQAGLQLLLSNMHGSAQGTAMAIRAMRGRVDGLLIMPPESDPAYLASSLPPGLPTVLINYPPGHVDVPSVAIDNYSGARAMTESLLERGYRKIAHISGPRDNRDARERLRGFIDAMRESAGELSALILPGDFTEEAGAEAARLIIAGNMAVDAVFAANDMMAVGCLAILREAGIIVPDQIAVAGFDDIPLARHTYPALSTVEVHIADMGVTAMTLLLAQLRGDDAPPQDHLLQPALMMRGTTAMKHNSMRRTTATDQREEREIS
jgi:LacI family transcriptional regulator